MVHISGPANGQAFNMFDTIIVSAHVSDENKLTSVVITLTDANNAVLQYTHSVTIKSKDFHFSEEYYLTDHHLPSGFYNISITANDGENTTQKHQQIYVTESPTLKTGYFIVEATQPKVISKYNTNMALQGAINLNTGYNGMAFGGYYQQLCINGNINQPLVGYDLANNANLWSYPYTGGSFPECMSVTTDGKKAYVGYFSGDISSITYLGVPSTGYSTSNSNIYAYYTAPLSKYCAAVFKDKFGTSDKIYGFYRNSGGVVNSAFMPIVVSGIYERTDEELYVVGNNTSNQAVIYLYTPATNGLVGPFTLPTGKLLSVAQVNNDYFLLAMNDGSIYGYRFSNSNYTVLAGVTAQEIVYNTKTAELCAAVKNSVYSYSLSSNYVLTQTDLKSVSDSIIGFEVITNK